MKPRDVALAAAIAAVVYFLALRIARKNAAPAGAPQYIPTGFAWDYRAGAYTKVGNDGLVYRYV